MDLAVPPTSRTNQRAFTLIEMVIVLTVLGLLAVIAVPRIDLGRFQANSAMQGTGSTILMAQRMAVTKQHDVIVLFDVNSQALLVHEDANNDGAVDAAERERRYPLGDKVLFGRGGAPLHSIGANDIMFTKVVRGMPAVTFRRNGSASEAGGFYMTTRRAVNSGGIATDGRVIEIERATGRASWYRYVNSEWKRGF
jgi:prepilin-type N-terminal cleavage/methylation domain-containing protein